MGLEAKTFENALLEVAERLYDCLGEATAGRCAYCEHNGCGKVGYDGWCATDTKWKKALKDYYALKVAKTAQESDVGEDG